MKTTFAALTALAIAAASALKVSAGDREWAMAGKILTGVVAGAVITRSFEPAPVYETRVVYEPPPATVVYRPSHTAVMRPVPVVAHRHPGDETWFMSRRRPWSMCSHAELGFISALAIITIMRCRFIEFATDQFGTKTFQEETIRRSTERRIFC